MGKLLKSEAIRSGLNAGIEIDFMGWGGSGICHGTYFLAISLKLVNLAFGEPCSSIGAS